MGLSKTEINLRRLLAAMPNQTNEVKLAQYIVTLREHLASLTGESGHNSLPCISEKKAKEYAEQIEAAASRIRANDMSMWDMLASRDYNADLPESSKELDLQEISPTTAGLRRRAISGSRNKHETRGDESTNGEQDDAWKSLTNQDSSAKVDSATLSFIEKHRHLQEDLTDEMVDLARQMKEATLAMNQAVEDSKKVLDSTEQAVEHSLASTNQANKRAQTIYSQSFNTGCLTWVIIFIMSCMFLLMVFFIRIT
ncbi:hypothetical protein KP509_27G070300 [Ceratopteris richardii]|uniref:USE1-like protein n=1 Tax=Ceratopteris richardii TaxID=49495 RepID=A0A8T2RJY6_CERRI|nr:hypothetical protein KP509_27G070300 [Ceratopteris richardii]